MSTRYFKLAIFSILTLLISACNPVLRTHGYLAAEHKPQTVEPGSDTKASVLARLGNPSIKGSFDDEMNTDTWYYMTSVRQQFAYLRPVIEDRTITAVYFNEEGQVDKVTNYGIEDGQYVDYADRTTPTRGKELSVLEQIFGSLGRLPSDRLGGQQDIPGGGGGPGSR